MRFDFELKFTPGEQIPHAAALSRTDFVDNDDNDCICFALDNIYFVQSGLETQSHIITELWLKRLSSSVDSEAETGNSDQKQRNVLNSRKTT